MAADSHFFCHLWYGNVDLRGLERVVPYLHKARHYDVDACGDIPLLYHDVIVLKLHKLGMVVDGVPDFSAEATQPGKIAEDDVGVGRGQAGWCALKVLHLYLNSLKSGAAY